ncbi:transporter substrate-binding domain-containing protein [Guyparkeria halophila]|uniref:Transporter substrate-binding domain-containing protein n=1 Tax=Guyparkeria halophila TaxID=47960 RepID=A0ABZ0YYB3_9GAMM|nr:transporter substrate-binding domain-containing protein [Guyparkeria halophila]WQH17173.1 transporter substrate-binding domain-containing protein [Guyparkeria halophila]
MQLCPGFCAGGIRACPDRRLGWLIRASVVFFTIVLLAGCDLPRDIEGTQDHVRNGLLRVGVIDGASPWATWSGGEPQGVETQLVRELAKRMGANIRWVSGSDTELFGALAAFELDVVIGGIERSSPWGKKVALTRPYHVTRIMLGWPPDQPASEDLDKRRVAVKQNSSVARRLAERGAVTVALEEGRDARLPVAAAESQILAWGLRPSPPVLETRKQVFAVPAGENGWLQTVQRFLFEKRADVPAMIRSEWSDPASNVSSHVRSKEVAVR